MFSSILGNELCKNFLLHAIEQNQLHHTLLFSGPSGIGKTLFAKKLAQNLLKSTPDRIEKESHPDFHLFRPEGKMGLHPMERVQELIQEVHKPPFESKEKVFIVYSAERMLPTSANALLKTFEEPCLDTTFILLSAQPRQILSTIASRCLHLSFSALEESQVKRYLLENCQFSEIQAEQEARIAQGSIGKAMRRVKNRQILPLQTLLFHGLARTMPAFQVAEEIESILRPLEGEEVYELVEDLLSLYLMRARDQELRHLKETKVPAYFPNEPSLPHLSLTVAQNLVVEIREALNRNVKISACFDRLLRNS